ncbi:DUF4190 domain-containing protein [Streptomyces sp. NPDC048270]|uniref:DUF4190 domain-containing protein n=1 Tax=Streptomyces sp. NPDC048270 TaxID=3154615 RepID=UPI0034105762
MSSFPPPPPPPEPNPPRWGPPGQPGQPGQFPSPPPPPPPPPPGQPPGPYGGPTGWYAPPPDSEKTNTLAVVAFLMSILCAIPLVPLILGIIALRQIRERRQKGRGLAIAAIVIHCVTLVFYALALVFGFSGVLDDAPKRDAAGQVTEEGSSDVEDLRAGDCFTTDDDFAEYQGKSGGDAPFTVTVVPCAQPHEGEAFAVFDLDDGPYPGREAVIETTDEKCSGTQLTDYVGPSATLPDELELYIYFPSEGTWDVGNRQVVCFLGDTNGSTTGSVRAPGS